MWLSEGTKSDWPYFARWHYRAAQLGAVGFVTVLWCDAEPVGICVFCSPAISISLRNRYFGLSGKWTSAGIKARNAQLVTLSRVVLHPTFRGAGIASDFIRRSCDLCPFPWVETLARMGHVNPVIERAGFVRVGTLNRKRRNLAAHSALYGGKRRVSLTSETHSKSRYGSPMYYVRRKGEPEA